MTGFDALRRQPDARGPRSYPDRRQDRLEDYERLRRLAADAMRYLGRGSVRRTRHLPQQRCGAGAGGLVHPSRRRSDRWPSSIPPSRNRPRRNSARPSRPWRRSCGIAKREPSRRPASTSPRRWPCWRSETRPCSWIGGCSRRGSLRMTAPGDVTSHRRSVPSPRPPCRRRRRAGTNGRRMSSRFRGRSPRVARLRRLPAWPRRQVVTAPVVATAVAGLLLGLSFVPGVLVFPVLPQGVSAESRTLQTAWLDGLRRRRDALAASERFDCPRLRTELPTLVPQSPASVRLPTDPAAPPQARTGLEARPRRQTRVRNPPMVSPTVSNAARSSFWPATRPAPGSSWRTISS